ncbi:MAG: hypothetical protein ACRD3B_02705 [Candidatus Sulfotelmatobacter sp.]
MSDKKVIRSLSSSASNSFNRNLCLYSVAAAAAGVGVLALAAPAEGKVVVTTKTIHLPFNQLVSLDLNRDGITDFQFTLNRLSSACGGDASLTIGIPAGNAVVGTGYVSALTRGAAIGPSVNFVRNGPAFVQSSALEYCSGSSERFSGGKWGGNPPNRYVGVKFLIYGATHYGWIRLSADFPARLGKQASATITAYAYETVANKPIKAGSAATAVASAGFEVMKPAQPSLGLLALGSDGAAIWRRKETLSPI